MYVKINKRVLQKGINKYIEELSKIDIVAKNVTVSNDKFLYVECTIEDKERIMNILKDDFIGISNYKYAASFNNWDLRNNAYKVKKDEFIIIGGPCSVESIEQISTITDEIYDNINILRGGAFKPRTSPYKFQGLGILGSEQLKLACRNKPIVSEVTCVQQIDYFIDRVDVIQVGARSMQNFELLKALGKTSKPIILKRGAGNTIDEWINAAEYIMCSGNKNVILCERGIKTHETYTRNTLDLSAVVVAKELTCLPVIVDPSHASGKWWMIDKLSKAALAVGADGVMIEVHHDPKNALSDGPQSLKPDKFNKLVDELRVLAPHFGKKVI